MLRTMITDLCVRRYNWHVVRRTALLGMRVAMVPAKLGLGAPPPEAMASQDTQHECSVLHEMASNSKLLHTRLTAP